MTSNEHLRRCQLFWNTFAHDVWLSLSTGRPCLIAAADNDHPAPWLPAFANDGLTPLKLISSEIYARRIWLGAIWLRVHENLYGELRLPIYMQDSSRPTELQKWLLALPSLDAEFADWDRDMRQLEVSVGLDRPKRMEWEAIQCARAIMSKRKVKCRSNVKQSKFALSFALTDWLSISALLSARPSSELIMHRSFLMRQFSSYEDAAVYSQQRHKSEQSVLQGAVEIVESVGQLIHLGVSMSFWFLAVNLQIASLALCELQNNRVDNYKAHSALLTAIGLLTEIAKSGENPAAGAVLDAVRSIQEASSISSGTSSNHRSVSISLLLGREPLLFSSKQSIDRE